MKISSEGSQCQVWLSWLYLLHHTTLHLFFPAHLYHPPLSFGSLIITQGLNLIHASALFWWHFIIENFKMNYLYTDELSHAALSFIIYAYLGSLLISGDPFMLLWALGCSFSSQESVLSLACVLATHNAMPLISVSLLANSFPTNSFSVQNGYKSKGACSQIA